MQHSKSNLSITVIQKGGAYEIVRQMIAAALHATDASTEATAHVSVVLVGTGVI